MSSQSPDMVCCEFCHILRCLEIHSKDKFHRLKLILEMFEFYVFFDISFFGVDEFADFEHVILNHVIELDGVVSVRIFLGEILF